MKKKSFSKFLILAIFFQLSFIASIIAQDTIYTTDARELSVTIESVDGSLVKFRPYGETESSVRTIDVQYVDFIKYENGTIERFVKSESAPVDESEASMDYLKIQYEKHLNKAETWSDVFLVGACIFGVSVGITIFAMINELVDDDWQANWKLIGSIGTAGLATGGIGLTFGGFHSIKSKNYKKRIDELSLVLVPNNHPLLKNNGNNFDDFSLGIRIRF